MKYLFLVSLAGYMFFSPFIVGYFGLIFVKTILISLMLFSFLYLLFFEMLKKQSILIMGLLIYYIFLLVVYLLINKNISEISLILSPLIAFIVVKKVNKSFYYILLMVLIIEVILLGYEYFAGSYIYNKVVLGIKGNEVYSISNVFYGKEMKIRPKGLFFGALDATSFLIMSGFLLEIVVLKSVIFISSVMTKGRLAMLINSFLFLFNIFHKSKKMKINIYLKINILCIVLSGLSFLFFWIYSNFLDNFMKEKLINLFSLKDVANFTRVYYYQLGMYEFINYDFLHFLFGKPSYFIEKYGNSAESGVINDLLNIGILGTLPFIFMLSYTFLKVLKYKNKYYLLVVFFIFISWLIYRFDSGYLRGVLLWYILFNLYYKNIGFPNIQKMKGQYSEKSVFNR